MSELASTKEKAAQIVSELRRLPMPGWATTYRPGDFPKFSVTSDLLMFTAGCREGDLSAAVIERGDPTQPFVGYDAVAGGFIEWWTDEDAEAAARREFREETRHDHASHLEELGGYTRNGRDPRQFAGAFDPVTGALTGEGRRIMSHAFYALIPDAVALRPRKGEDARAAGWRSIYDYLPWEDRRSEYGNRILREIRDHLEHWSRVAKGAERDRRSATIAFAFGEAGSQWNEERTIERYELMHDAGLVEEAHRDLWGELPAEGVPSATYGRTMAFDHRHMLANALGRIRGKLKYVPAVLLSLMPGEFLFRDVHATCEAVLGRGLYGTNLRRVFLQRKGQPLLVPTGRTRATEASGPDPELYRFADTAAWMRLDPSLRMPFRPFQGA